MVVSLIRGLDQIICNTRVQRRGFTDTDVKILQPPAREANSYCLTEYYISMKQLTSPNSVKNKHRTPHVLFQTPFCSIIIDSCLQLAGHL